MVVVGSTHAVALASTQIEAMILRFKAFKREEAEAKFRVVAEIPFKAEAVSLIVGKGGSNLKKCKEVSGCKDLKIDDKARAAPNPAPRPSRRALLKKCDEARGRH